VPARPADGTSNGKIPRVVGHRALGSAGDQKAIQRRPKAASISWGAMMKRTPAARRRAIYASKSSTS
jgi:hypothetical protein